MRPRSPTAAERQVIRWFFGIAFAVAIVFIAWSALSRRQECIAACEAKGLHGSLQLNAGGRFNLGTSCTCRR